MCDHGVVSQAEEAEEEKRRKAQEEEDAKKAGTSLAVFLRKRKTGAAGLDAFMCHYPQLKELFLEVDNLQEFMLVFANNLLRDR